MKKVDINVLVLKLNSESNQSMVHVELGDSNSLISSKFNSCVFFSGSRRNWIQVICNGGVATFVAILFMLEGGCGERLVDFIYDYTVTWLCMSVLGSLACAAGDTFASEFGTVLGQGKTKLIINGKPVPKGIYLSYMGING